MDNIFSYDNWPYFFIAIVAFLILINMRRCHDAGRFLTLNAKNRAERRAAILISNPANEAAVAQISEKIAAQTAAEVAAKIAAQTTSQVLTENFAKTTKKPVVVYKSKDIPSTFTGNVKVIPRSEKFRSVQRVAQRENFAPFEDSRKLEGVDMGAAGCNGEGCKDCYENLNDQINLGVNNYIFPSCNNDQMCLNGCNIQEQINEYQYDYRMGQSVTELERSNSGAYTSLNSDSCSQNCPSMEWLPPNSNNRDAAAEYISTLKKK